MDYILYALFAPNRDYFLIVNCLMDRSVSGCKLDPAPSCNHVSVKGPRGGNHRAFTHALMIADLLDIESISLSLY